VDHDLGERHGRPHGVRRRRRGRRRGELGAEVIGGEVAVDGNLVTCAYHASVGLFMRTVFAVAAQQAGHGRAPRAVAAARLAA
jgi:hypothetical protein